MAVGGGSIPRGERGHEGACWENLQNVHARWSNKDEINLKINKQKPK